jgi:hypothetical protein
MPAIPAGAVAVALAAGAALSSAQAGAPKATAPSKASIAKTRFMICSLQGIDTGFTGTDANNFFEVEDEDLAVTDLAGAGGSFDGFNDLIELVISDADLDLHLGKKIDDIFRTPVQLGVSFLPAEAFNFSDRDPLHADRGQRLTDFVKLEWLDDGGYEFHELSPKK